MLSQQPESNDLIIEIYISAQAMERLRKDKYIKEKKKKYSDIIFQIANSKCQYPAERIGNFNVSPRGSVD